MLIFFSEKPVVTERHYTKVIPGNRISFCFSDSVTEMMLTNINTMCIYSQEQDNVIFSLALKSIPYRLARAINKATVFKKHLNNVFNTTIL